MGEPRPPWGIARVRTALRRRRHGPYPALGRIEEQLGALAARLTEIETRLSGAAGIEQRLEELASTGVDRGDLAGALRALASGEAENRRLLGELRESTDYERAWTEAGPLVSVTVATLGRPELTSRALPSIIAQSHGNLEVIVARDSRAEAVYGQVRAHHGDDVVNDICTFPPRLGRFTWAGGIYHGGLRFFGRELLAADLGLPGDWWLAERMLRAGVRFAMVDEVLCDIYPSARAARVREVPMPWGEL